MFKKLYYAVITAIVVVIIAIGMCVYRSRAADTIDYFDIGTDIVMYKQPYTLLDNPTKCLELLDNRKTCVERPDIHNPTQYGGLNPKFNANLTVRDFINTYGTGENYNSYGTADVTARRYCNLLYAVNNEYFSDRWSSTSECELAAKAECQDLFPNAPKKSYFGY